MKIDYFKNKKWMAGVSGGPDSMALLDMYKDKIVGVCHVNYHKRKDSDYDQHLVQNYCSLHHIPLAILNVKHQQYVSTKINNFQANARKIRYDFFVKCSKKFKTKNLLIAHNLNDFLETAKMQEKRKSRNFYYGIRKYSTYNDLFIYRPLITKMKDDLINYCQKNNIEYAIDSSNTLNIYERNIVRKQLNKLSKKQFLLLKKKYDARNKKMAKTEEKILVLLTNWKKHDFSIKCLIGFHLSSTEFDNLIYMYLKINNITNINHSKILLIKGFIFSKKVNQGLRIEHKKYLFKIKSKLYIKSFN